LNLGSEKMSVTIHKDYMLMQSDPYLGHVGRESHQKSFSRFSTYDPENDAKKRSKYPVTWVID